MISSCAHCGESVERATLHGETIWLSAGTTCPDGQDHVVDLDHASRHMGEEG